MASSGCNDSRRSFLKRGLIICSALPVMSALTSPSARADESLKALDSTNAQATALGYVEDASSNKEIPEKSRCSNCALMLQAGLKAEGKEGDWGKCALFPTNVVSVNGWCKSWAPKAS